MCRPGNKEAPSPLLMASWAGRRVAPGVREWEETEAAGAVLPHPAGA
jgi:hypothetical protein